MKTLRQFFSRFDAKDIPALMVILGIVLVGYGCSRLHDGLGYVIVGLLLVLYVKPLSRFVK